MIFINLRYDPLVQQNDKMRLDASTCFSQGEIISNVEIEPYTGAGFFTVYNANQEKWFVDWAYTVIGSTEISVRVTTNLNTETKTFDLEVVDASEDNLFSNDSHILPFEPTLYKYLPVGRSSFIYAHRAARDKILAYLDEQRIWKNNGAAYTKADIFSTEDFKRWSMFQTLLIIFDQNQLITNDIFKSKRDDYENEMRQARNRASLRLDTDGDGEIDPVPYNIRSTPLIRR